MNPIDLVLVISGVAMVAALIVLRRQHAVEMEQTRSLERESSERKQYYRTVFANAGVGIVRLDAVGTIIEANESFQEFIGFSFEELKTRSIFSLVHPEDRDGVQARAMLSAAGENRGQRVRFLRKDGSVRWGDVRTSVIKHPDGSFQAFIAVIVDITERKAAELGFQEGQEKLHQITENLGAAVFQMRRGSDGTPQFTYLNEEAERIVGVPRARLFEQASEFFGLIEPDDLVVIERGMTEAARRQEKWSGDFRLRQAGGGFRWLFGKAVPRREGEGVIVWNGYFSDITERRQLDQKFRAIFDSSFDAYFLIDPKGRALDCNLTAIKAFQATGRDEVLTLGPLGFSPDQQPDGKRSFDTFQALIAEAMTAGHIHGEWRFRARGKEMPADLTLIRLDVSRPPILLAVIHDLTERKKAEAEVVESRNLLRGVIDNSMAVICAKDTEGRYLLVNRRWGEILELAEADVVGKTDVQIFPADQAQDYRRNDLQVLQTRKPLTIEEHAVIDGERRTFLAVKFPIIDLDGNPRAVCGISTDITDLKKIHADLHEARQQAEAANQAKSQFLANMSHEIRTPMNAIMGFAYLALQSDPPDRIQDHLRKIQSAAKGLLGIINEILDFSKIEVGRLTLEHIEFDLEQVVDNVSGMITLRAQEKGLELLLAVDPDVPRQLIGDPLRLEQILVNLASNAVKFTEQGEVVVRVRLLPDSALPLLESESAPNPVSPEGEGKPASGAGPVPARVMLEFQVHDTGVGLTPEQINQLFQPFTQADGSTTRKYGGTGLGLSICKRLVEMMHGTIGVSSEAGQGSTFTFTAGFGKAAGTEFPLPAPDLRNLKVLVVDDHPASREYLSRVLISLSFEVVEARDGREALGILERPVEGKPIELILMDWQMPGLDGIETSRRIQAMHGRGKTPTIIMVTAFGRDKAMAHAGDVPIDEFLVKPVTPSTLFETIMRVFRQEHPGRRAEVAVAEADLDLGRLAGVRALLVEDNDLNQEVAVSMLSRIGMVVQTAENGKEALARLDQASFDLVLMDCQMPVMDGYECTTEIRRREWLAGLPVIAMTANAVAGDRDRCLAVGMNDHVAKPIDPGHLFRVLLRWAPAAGTSGSSGPPAGGPPSSSGTAPRFGTNVPLPAAKPLGGAVGEGGVSGPGTADLERITGIDLPTALSRLGGDAVLLRGLLRKFRQRNLDFGEQVMRAVDGGHWVEAKRLAHTLKGVAATLGARGIPELAAELEILLGEQRRAEATPALMAVQAGLLALCAQIEDLPGELVGGPAGVAGSVAPRPVVAEVLPLIHDLLTGLRNDDAEAVSLFNRLREGLAGAPELASDLAALGKLLDAYAFTEAIPLAEALTQRLASF